MSSKRSRGEKTSVASGNPSPHFPSAKIPPHVGRHADAENETSERFHISHHGRFLSIPNHVRSLACSSAVRLRLFQHDGGQQDVILLLIPPPASKKSPRRGSWTCTLHRRRWTTCYGRRERSRGTACARQCRPLATGPAVLRCEVAARSQRVPERDQHVEYKLDAREISATES